LHTIKTKPIASYRVDIYIEQNLCDWFEKEYRLVLEFISIYYGNRIYNINEKKARIACPTREEIVVPINIKEIYMGVLENRLYVIVVEYISADRRAILLLVIVPGVMLIE
jgi:hypothetical protein